MRKFLFIIIIITISVQAQTEAFNPEDYRNREITAVRLEKPLDIDGILDESLYETPTNTTFFQYVPNNGELASEQTEFWVGYDNNAIYVGARMYDSSPDSIVARLGRRDTGYELSDQFGVVIDSYNDNRSGFFFIINPMSTIFDGTLQNDSQFDTAWDGIWDGKTLIDEQGWTAEMRIPFSQLRFNESDEVIMGFHVARNIHRRAEDTNFQHVPRDVSGTASHFPTLYGIKNISPPKRMEVLPYVTGNYSSLKSKEDNPFYNGKDSNVNIGTDLKVGIGNNITLDATINPDFGQVEADPSVINLTAYETYYQEKRPFFIEGASIFGFGRGGPTSQWNFNWNAPSFFYSRRIGAAPHGWADGDWVDQPSATSIIGATKLSGKLPGNWSIGGFSALTNREFARVKTNGEESTTEVEPLTSFNLIRSQKEFNDGLQGLGFMGTYVYRNFDDQSLREILSDNALAFGLDGWTFLNEDKDWVIGAWAGMTEVSGSKERMLSLQKNSSHYFQRPDADHLELDENMTKMRGYSGRAILNKETGNVNVNISLGFTSPGFEINDLGLNFGTDRINYTIAGGYKWLKPGKIFRFANLNTAHSVNYNFNGDIINQMTFLLGYYQFQNYWSAHFVTGIGPQTLSDNKLRGGPMVNSPGGFFSRLSVDSDSRKDFRYDLSFEYWTGDNNSYDHSINPGFSLNIGSQIRLQIEPEYSVTHSIDQYVGAWEDENATAMYGNRYIVAQMDRETFATEFRIDYTFTPKLSFQAYVQPYMTVGSYSHFKEFAKPKSYDFWEYGVDNSSTIIEDEDGYTLDPTGGDDSDEFYVDNPDFNYKALIGSAVLRWEFRPGSTLYLVWTRNGSDTQNPGIFDFNRDIKNLFQADADNVFALKVTYWFGK
jgi:hypothetical protein